MKNKPFKLTFALTIAALLAGAAPAQQQGYKFTDIKEIPRTSVKRQIGGTCWCYASLSLLESEIIRTQKKELDLSEMFIVCKLLPEKAENYVRLGGITRVADGGLGHHVINPWRRFGLVPDEVCPHVNVRSLFTELRKMLDERVKSRQGYTPEFNAEVEALIEKHVGKLPDKFNYQDKEYTPKTFAEQVVRLNPDEYIELTSYNHHPFYQQIRLEIPDNWDFSHDFYNVPIDELEQIVDDALNKGYTIMWDGDVSERGKYDESKGYAIIPVDGPEGEKIPAQEPMISQEMRQETFNTFSTTDDHLMHLVGVAHDQNGTKFYLIKNSHGANRGPYDGNLYMSQAYFRLKTVSIMVNRNSIPRELARKLRIRPREIKE